MSHTALQQVPEGYRQTEVGLIPEGWCVKSIGAVLSIRHGRDQKQVQCDDGVYPILGTGGEMGRTNTFLYDKPSVLIGRKGTINKPGYMDSPFWTVDTLFYSEVDNKHSAKFVYYKFCMIDWMAYNEASGVPSLNASSIERIQFSFPVNKEEQTAIAKALSDVDALIASLEKLIAKKRDIKTATMQQLLTGKKRLPPFDQTHTGYKKTELGDIPEDWELIELGEQSDITKLAGFEYSNYFNAYKDGGKIIVLRGTNITNNILDLSDVRNIPEATSKMLPRSKLFSGDLVFAYVGTIGPVYLVKEDDRFHLGPNTAKITCKKNINNQYLLAYFKSTLIRSEIEEKISVGAQPSLSMTKIRSFKIILPSLEEQKLIANTIMCMDEELYHLGGRLNKTQQLKQGMMQELLTGRTRLV